ncbi:uncharacterized protein LY79DRAFT_549957 [Colletotrichum navitas]|uniref:Uncharacterized protein n=1 Tax=Colletotrichum navitas TaxID=681940 RepID=A0AAD8V5V5_9PEZI|nr:uncharacterized protein LY79DRAFT_549957 [Colletotrichum navitas]KAK1594139.1 hypothetical protein LY79DRAFT_549957 [Colletotrichum navitas]
MQLSASLNNSDALDSSVTSTASPASICARRLASILANFVLGLSWTFFLLLCRRVSS